ncbi:MAG: GNAT family N-acetyltransferase [Anaerolineae bacterium]|nr:GNAT family N-acetyltransferase [Anaerolineae bacterium]
MNLPRDLGDGLILRRAENQEDIERIIELDNAVVQIEDPGDDVSGWIHSMTDGKHPTTTLQDFYLVEDTAKDRFVSSLCLIPQTWTYGGIPFGVGRPEIVMTLPDYRRRGLVRAQFEALHADCAARGLVVQGITGIPYFYRLFDYEYALTLSAGCDLPLGVITNLKEDAEAPFAVRPLVEADIPTAMVLAAASACDKLVVSVSDEAIWRHVIGGARHIASESFYALTEHGRMVGYFNVGDMTWFGEPVVHEIVLAGDVPCTAAIPCMLRELKRQIETRWPDKDLTRVQFEMGDEHPAYPVLTSVYQARQRELPYAWYIRVPDVPGFVRHIAPALEKHLAAGPTVAGYSGEVNIGFYRRPGLGLKFEAGKLTEVKAIAVTEQEIQAAFPPLVFLKLLFGYRSFDELKYSFPDVWANAEARLVLGALFPKQPSWVRMLG